VWLRVLTKETCQISIMSAAQERERRVTAGKRINFLAGQELEQDEAFWGHDTWQEDSDSFHSSDVASQEEVDEFDSDFDLSENDHETTELEEQIGAAAERDIALEEREQKKRSGAYVDTAKKKGFPVARGKKGAGGGRPSTVGRRIIGEGLNAGIVLNVPLKHQKHYDSSRAINDTSSALLIPQHTTALSVSPIAYTAASASDVPSLVASDGINSSIAAVAPQTAPAPLSQTHKKGKVNKPTLAATRIRRKSGKASSEAAGASVVTSRKSLARDEQVSSNPLKRGKQIFTQEQMLIEAVQDTEPENERWILGRKRSQAEKDDLEQFLVRNNSLEKHGKLVEKFVSRHGYLNTITFPDMDHLPEIMQNMSKQPRPKTDLRKQVCAITGKRAKYRDPKSGLGYYDIAAYRELRRRYEANELNLDPVEAVVQNGSASSAMGEATTSGGRNELIHSSTKPKTSSIRTSNISGTKRKSLERKPRPAKKTVVESLSVGQNGCELPSTSSNGTTAYLKNDAIQETAFDSKTSGSIDEKKPLLSPPLSPGRKSPRHRKPTSKVLENVLVQPMPSFTNFSSQLETSVTTVITAPKSAEIQ
jgi:YL1 nuclear protein C-terminal domain/YL1 nuclear protein